MECSTEIRQFTYELYLGYCRQCYKQELYKDDLQKACLAEVEAMSLAEQKYYQISNHKLKADSAFYEKKNLCGQWVVSLKLNLEEGIQMDPDRLFVIIDDRTGDLLDIPIIV